MGTRILHTGIATARKGPGSRSAIRLSAKAGLACLDAAGMPAEDLDCLINAGIFRDLHLGEPAIASLIHGEIAKRGGILPIASFPGKFFCFDVSNGGIGALNGLEIASGLLESEKIQSALVVAGDALPRRADRRSFTYSPAASAILLVADPQSGFKKFFYKSFPAYQTELSAELRWAKKEKRSKHQHLLVLEQNPEYLDHCLLATANTLNEFLLSVKRSITDFDLMITSLSPNNWRDQLESKLGLPAGLLLKPMVPDGIHTASLGMGLHSAEKAGRLKTASNILLLSVGSGIQVSLAWYQNPRS